MKILNLHTLTEEFKFLYGKPFGTQVKYLWNKSWKRMPEVMLLGVMSFGGLIPLLYCTHKRNGERPPRYYRHITIFRPDDPRVPLIRTDNSVMLQRPI